MFVPAISVGLVLFLSTSIATAQTCSSGRLFISDSDSPSVATYELDGGTVTLVNTVQSRSSGHPVDLWELTSPNLIAHVYVGSNDQNRSDGGMGYISTGLSIDSETSTHGAEGYEVTKSDPVALPFRFKCTNPVHVKSNFQKTTLMCDGSYSSKVNSTLLVVDEKRVPNFANGDSQSPILLERRLAGAHHGVAYPMENDAVLVTVPTPERVQWGNTGTSSLPDGFEIINEKTGDLLHNLNTGSQVTRSCSGYHGSAYSGKGVYSFACDADHGGLLVVQEQNDKEYSTWLLSYPDEYAGYRTASVQGSKSGVVVGAFTQGTNNYHLVAYNPLQEGDTIDRNEMLELPEKQCFYDFEQSADHLLVVYMPDGYLYVYEVKPHFMLIAKTKVFDSPASCKQTTTAVGYRQVFVAKGTTLKTIDLSQLDNIQVTTTPNIAVSAFSMVVAGAPKGHECSTNKNYLTGTTRTDGRKVTVKVKYDKTWSPGSAAEHDFLLQVRNAFAKPLNVGLNRIYVENAVKKSDYLKVTLNIVAAGPNDTSGRAEGIYGALLKLNPDELKGVTVMSIEGKESSGGSSTGGSSTGGSNTGGSNTGGSTGNNDSIIKDNDDDTLSPGGIIGIAASCIALVLIVVIAGVYIARNQSDGAPPKDAMNGAAVGNETV